jgi:hypothetical protein
LVSQFAGLGLLMMVNGELFKNLQVFMMKMFSRYF